MDDYSLLSIIEYLYEAKNLEEVELQIYGNQFSVEMFCELIDSMKEIKLKKLNLSIFEFMNQEKDPMYARVVEKFEALGIADKKLT